MALHISEKHGILTIEYKPMFSWLSLIVLFLIPTLFIFPFLVGFGAVLGSILSALCFVPFIAIFLVVYFLMPKTKIVVNRLSNKVELSSSTLFSSSNEVFDVNELKGIYVKRFYQMKVTDYRNMLRKVPVVSYYLVFALPDKLVYVKLKATSKGKPYSGDKEVEEICDALSRFLFVKWTYVEGKKGLPSHITNMEKPRNSLGVIPLSKAS